MFSKSLITRLALIVTVSSSAAFTAAPALAQDAFGSGGQFAQNSLGATGTQSRLNYTTGSQTQHLFDGSSPTLQGATNGTIAAQGVEATVVQGVNTAGTVRVNNLANMEALLNIIANGMEILGIAWGGPTMIWGFMHMAAGSQQAMKKVLFGAAGVTGGLATPGCINWLVASARDAALFN
ncbi:MAG: hypothetical protein QG574_1182 [Cyanobacteriota bacterium erpe_2018_sw_21hr_WHONDRS-SW48-000092_B_bin.40]|jgi:hypothetical protein|nr:hypothetical protein [Cyanobacteriota bacterium erpe_2018_sw_21hr_WHONDRS-SW48-000092_B_bin.40]